MSDKKSIIVPFNRTFLPFLGYTARTSLFSRISSAEFLIKQKDGFQNGGYKKQSTSNLPEN